MKLFKWIALASITTMMACGGVSAIGSGDDNGGSSNKGGNASGGSGSNKGGSVATGGTAPGVGGGVSNACMSDQECLQPGAPCELCADGSAACPKVFCKEGQCVGDFPSCGNGCQDDKECPVIDIACADCGDGTVSCPTSQCIMGKCESGFPGCGGTDPCQGLECGTQCKPCGPDGNCDLNVLSYCSAEGKCQPGLPQCGGLEQCQTAMDCPPAPPNCVSCSDDQCAGFDCLMGKCVFTCPPDPDPECKTELDCPMAELCKECPNSTGCAETACIRGSCELVCPLK